jgi:hypothetical protein
LIVTRITRAAVACALAFFVGALVAGGGLRRGLFSGEPRTDPRVSAELIEDRDDHGIDAESAGGQLVPSVIGVTRGAGTFSLRATARRLFPGKRRPLRVRISNPNRFAIKVTRIRVRVKPDRTHLSCPPDQYVRKTRFTKSIRVRPRRSRRVRLAIKLLYSAPDACQGAAFPMRLRGRAVRA